MAEGYAKIAELMSGNDELAILRGFRTLNMQSLLYQQAEITFLERTLKRLTDHDREYPNRRYHSKDWWSLANCEDEEGQEQWEVAQQIQVKLEKYNSTIAQLTYISKQPKPNSYDLHFLRDWLHRPKMGNYPLVGADRNSWAEQDEKDLIALRARKGDDAFSRWFTDKLIPWLHNLVLKRFKKPLATEPLSEISEYSESHVNAGISILATVIASLLPLSSIVVLNFVPAPNSRLGIITAFAALFSFCLAILTQGRRIEIFAATSAFAAVQVVFLTNGNGNGNRCSC